MKLSVRRHDRIPCPAGLKLSFCVLVLIILAMLNYCLHYRQDHISMTTNNTWYTSYNIYKYIYHQNRTLASTNSIEPQLTSNLSSMDLSQLEGMTRQNETDTDAAENATSTELLATSNNTQVTSFEQFFMLPKKPASKDLQPPIHELHSATGNGEPPDIATNRLNMKSTLATPAPPLQQGGYVLTLKVYEQQTMASGNLIQLQCWARSLNLSVVKPFVKDSVMTLTFDKSKIPQMLRLDDAFDMEEWNHYAEEKDYAPLVDLSQFLKEAPRKVIVVQLKHPALTTVKKIQHDHPFPHPPEGDEYKRGCKENFLKSTKSTDYMYLRSKGFQVVRRVCFNFQTGDRLSSEQFQKDLLGQYSPHEVTIIMDMWKGLGEPQRVMINMDRCVEKEDPFRERVKPSQRLIQDAERYTAQYLGGNAYLAVISRFEMTALTRRVPDNSDPYAIIPHCLKETLAQWRQLKLETGLNTAFLSIDIGKYGSNSFAHTKYRGHLKEMMAFLKQMYDGRMILQEWEKTFEATSGTTDAGYIALLQQVIVTRAKCILFVGGGSFQRRALHLYQQLHPNPEDQCVRVVRQCTSAYRPVQR